MKDLIFPAINLALLLGFLIWKLKTPAGTFVKTRHREVFEGLNRAKAQAASVAQRKAEIEAKLKNLDAERAAIAAEWKQRGSEQAKAIQEGSVRVVAQMRKEFEQNKAALAVTLQGEMLRVFRRNVISQAEAKIKQALNPEMHHKLNQQFVAEAAIEVSAR